MNKGEICDWLDNKDLICNRYNKLCPHLKEMMCGNWFGWCNKHEKV